VVEAAGVALDAPWAQLLSILGFRDLRAGLVFPLFLCLWAQMVRKACASMGRSSAGTGQGNVKVCDLGVKFCEC
jgi:hypothetical protein